LQLKFSALPLARYWAYVPDSLPLLPAGGVLGTDLAIRFSQPTGGSGRLSLSGSVAVDDLGVSARDGAKLIGWRRLAVGLADVRPFERSVALSSLELDGLSADVRRDAAGRLQWQTLFAKPDAVPPPQAASAPWQFSVASLSISDATLRWRDASTRPAAALDLRPLQLRAEALAWPDATPSPMKASLQLHAGPQADQAAGRVDQRGRAHGLGPEKAPSARHSIASPQRVSARRMCGRAASGTRSDATNQSQPLNSSRDPPMRTAR
jgi:hypothetical protein